MNIEICAGNIEDIIIAEKLNISRIELNQGLSIGGLTPSHALVKQALKISTKDIVVMIRPREGDFTYTENEYMVMKEDAKYLLKLPIKGIVFGFLNYDNSIDVKRTKKFITLAKKYNKEAIFHRAIDVSNDYINNLILLKNLGITRILTSGHEKNAELGIENIKKAIKENLPIIVGCGINANNIHKFKNLGITDIHGSFSKKILNDYTIDFGNYTILDKNIEKNIDFNSF
ncbi:copper homeostasis protein CutC [Streptobacillus moniliformis]|uniref:copper homeostasis protein CutC n=1 Tax=Streptobacillus moniliformis TaxID=34105 RepID=UPI0007E3486D|nr:copper homeostasis protein CutC [Streptobacillus moniliformis]QXW65746.1 copper homeostasis protein CutC [Streptobacillus moniliformis]